jgi:hypothetical protein
MHQYFRGTRNSISQKDWPRDTEGVNMKRSMKCGLVLLTMLMSLSIGVAFAEMDMMANKMIPNVVSLEFRSRT